MTDVMDESVSWEQRREMRRKKRQELLAEADRLVKTTEPTQSTGLSRLSRERVEMDDDDEFERERQRRRREREERRRKEREELEKQLKEEEEQRAERDRRREERRRQREEAERASADLYTSRTVITKSVDSYSSYTNHEEPAKESVTTDDTNEYPVENGHENDEEEVENNREEPEPEEEEEEEEETSPAKSISPPPEEEEEEEEEAEPEVEPDVEDEKELEQQEHDYEDEEEQQQYGNEDDEDNVEVQQKLNEMKAKRDESIKDRFDTSQDDSSDDHKARLKAIEERRKLREQKEKEEEEKMKEEAAKREAEHQEQLRIEREEREKRRAEAEEKRKAYRKQLSQSEDSPSAPLSSKSLTSPLVSKVEQLNKQITDLPKTTKSPAVANVGSLDSRLEKYTKQASKQEVKKTAGTPGKIGQDVSDRRNKWERGEVTSGEKTGSKREPVTSGSISSRKNLWESGKVASSSVKSSRKADDLKGADLSSRKNQWLKVTAQATAAKKSESPVTMKTGVLSRLNQWEKGEVSKSSPGDKAKSKANIPASGVGNRRAKWENINTESPKTSGQKKPVKVSADVSNKKNLFENKATEQKNPPPSKRLSESDEVSKGRRYDDDEEDLQYSDEGDEYGDE